MKKKKQIGWTHIKMIISSKEVGSQEELLQELNRDRRYPHPSRLRQQHGL